LLSGYGTRSFSDIWRRRHLCLIRRSDGAIGTRGESWWRPVDGGRVLAKW